MMTHGHELWLLASVRSQMGSSIPRLFATLRNPLPEAYIFELRNELSRVGSGSLFEGNERLTERIVSPFIRIGLKGLIVLWINYLRVRFGRSNTVEEHNYETNCTVAPRLAVSADFTGRVTG